MPGVSLVFSFVEVLERASRVKFNGPKCDESKCCRESKPCLKSPMSGGPGRVWNAEGSWGVKSPGCSRAFDMLRQHIIQWRNEVFVWIFRRILSRGHGNSSCVMGIIRIQKGRGNFVVGKAGVVS